MYAAQLLNKFPVDEDVMFEFTEHGSKLGLAATLTGDHVSIYQPVGGLWARLSTARLRARPLPWGFFLYLPAAFALVLEIVTAAGR